MTQPVNGQHPQPGVTIPMPLAVNSGAKLGPDGRPWCVLQVLWGHTTTQWEMPMEAAEVLKQALEAKLSVALRTAREMAGGIQVAGAEVLRQLGEPPAQFRGPGPLGERPR